MPSPRPIDVAQNGSYVRIPLYDTRPGAPASLTRGRPDVPAMFEVLMPGTIAPCVARSLGTSPRSHQCRAPAVEARRGPWRPTPAADSQAGIDAGTAEEAGATAEVLSASVPCILAQRVVHSVVLRDLAERRQKQRGRRGKPPCGTQAPFTSRCSSPFCASGEQTCSTVPTVGTLKAASKRGTTA